MIVAIGHSHHADAKLAALVAFNTAQQQIKQPDLVLAFCNHGLDPQNYYLSLRALLGDDVPIIGGSAIGVITNDFLRYQGATSAIAFIQCQTMTFQLASAEHLFKDPEQTGYALSHALSETHKASLLFLLYDSIKYAATSTSPAVLNPSHLLLKGLSKSLSPMVPVVGAGLLGDHQFNPITHFSGYSISNQSASAVLFSSAVKPHIAVMHGCKPLSGREFTITDIFGQFLYTLDGQPVVDVIDQAYGSQHWRQQSPVRTLCLGRQHEQFDSQRHESCFTNRLISGILPDNEGIILFEPDFRTGDKVQLMQRDTKRTIQSAKEQTRQLVQQIKQADDTPLFALYINCGGRAAVFEDSDQEEAAEVQLAMNQAKIPLLGFYCGVEIAPVHQKSQGLDWSGVLVIFCR